MLHPTNPIRDLPWTRYPHSLFSAEGKEGVCSGPEDHYKMLQAGWLEVRPSVPVWPVEVLESEWKDEPEIPGMAPFRRGPGRPRKIQE